MELDKQLVSYSYKGKLIHGTIIKYQDYYYLLNNEGYLNNGGMIKTTIFEPEWGNNYKYCTHIKDLENIEIIPEIHELWN